MISVVICRPEGEAWKIDTWLMSCRVLGRRVEQMVLRELVLAARARGIKTLIGLYIPTERNNLVAEHYAKLGFAPRGEADASGTTEWIFDTSVDVPTAPMRVQRINMSAEQETTA